jgi:hypothetical protein
MQAAMTVPAGGYQILGAFMVDAPVVLVMNLDGAIATARAVPSDLAAKPGCGLGLIRLQFPSVGAKIFMVAFLSVGHVILQFQRIAIIVIRGRLSNKSPVLPCRLLLSHGIP